VTERYRRLEAGVYSAPDGTLHVVIPELLEAAGYQATPENVDIVAKAWEAKAAEMGAALRVHE
jgi:hypothetical protein